MSRNAEQFYQQMADAISDVRGPILKDHVEFYEELLSHLLMGDLRRYVESDGVQRKEVVSFLEDAFTGTDDEIDNPIAVSFVENMTKDEIERALAGVNAPKLEPNGKDKKSGNLPNKDQAKHH